MLFLSLDKNACSGFTCYHCDFKICPYCGKTIEKDKTSDNSNEKTTPNKKIDKKTIAIIGVVALVVIVVIAIIVTSGNGKKQANYENSTKYSYNSNNEYDNEDSFGNDEEVTAVGTEAPTAETVDNIELIYDDIIYSHHGSDRGAIKIINYNIVRNSNGSISIYLDFEKAVEPDGPYESSFAVDAYFYDSNGVPLGEQQACYVSNFKEGKTGKKYKDSIVLPSSTADSTVKVEIVGG